MADKVMDPQKLAYFQEVTGVKDTSLSHQILDAYGWDLDAAVQAMVDKNTNEIPEYEEGMRAAASGSSSYAQTDGQVRTPERSPGLTSASSSTPSDGFGSTPVNDDRYIDDRTIFERIGDGDVLDRTNVEVDNPDGSNFVWRVVTLPFAILRGSYNLIYGAVGFGVWMAGGVLSASLGAMRLNGGPNRGSIGGGNQLETPALISMPSGAFEASNFLRSFERQYGNNHPEFQAVSFMEALRRAGQEFKFLFVYLHSSHHMNTPLFCEGTLGNEVVVDFINENFIAWGGDVHTSEGYQMSNTLKASTFPFCAVIMGSSNMRIAVLQQVEGYQSAGELLSLLQKVVEEQSASLIAGRQEQEEHEMNCRLREEQDEAYRIGLQADQERDRRGQAEADQMESERFEAAQKKMQQDKEAAQAAHFAAQKEASLEQYRSDKAAILGAEPEKGQDVTHVAIRLPTGERKERRFESSAKVQALYDYIESLKTFTANKFSLVSNFPRVVYSAEKVHLTLKEAGLHPRSSLFVQVDDEDNGDSPDIPSLN